MEYLKAGDVITLKSAVAALQTNLNLKREGYEFKMYFNKEQFTFTFYIRGKRNDKN